MSYLKAKSEFNIEAAGLLIEETLFAPSVHCSYYGCFQYIKSKLNSVGITYDQMSREITSSRQSGGVTLTSHNYPIRKILTKIEEKEGGTYRKKVGDKIKELKTYREISDYHNVEVNITKSRSALDLSKEIIKLINDKL